MHDWMNERAVWLWSLALIAGCGSGAPDVDAARVDASSLDAHVIADAASEVDASSSPDAGRDAASTMVDAASGQSCGTRGTGPCPTNQFCARAIGADCGRADAPGTCRTPPLSCASGGATVCGCDGNTYENECFAFMAQSGIDYAGPCGGSADVSCDPRVTCRAAPPDCAGDTVPSVLPDGSCWTGECVEIVSCACATADECPEHDTYTCLVSEHHCGPFL